MKKIILKILTAIYKNIYVDYSDNIDKNFCQLYFKGYKVGYVLVTNMPNEKKKKNDNKETTATIETTRSRILTFLTNVGFEPMYEKNELPVPTDEVRFMYYRRDAEVHEIVMLSDYSVIRVVDQDVQDEVIYRQGDGKDFHYIVRYLTDNPNPQ